MEVTIKNIGKNYGTTGWLKKQFETGKMFISEGVTLKNKPGLWLKHEDKREMCLALYNPYDLSKGEYSEAEKFERMDHTGECEPYSIFNVFSLTPAASEAVKNIAQQWCDKKIRIVKMMKN